jgi:hypothetical protein
MSSVDSSRTQSDERWREEEPVGLAHGEFVSRELPERLLLTSSRGVLKRTSRWCVHPPTSLKKKNQSYICLSLGTSSNFQVPQRSPRAILSAVCSHAFRWKWPGRGHLNECQTLETWPQFPCPPPGPAFPPCLLAPLVSHLSTTHGVRYQVPKTQPCPQDTSSNKWAHGNLI